MKGFMWIIITFYLFVTVLWIANSPYLFSAWGMSAWGSSIVLGFMLYSKVRGNFQKKVLIYSTYFMVFLVIVTGLIHATVTSMP